MPDRAHVAIFDTTLRDGEQSPGCSMTGKEKLRLAHQLDRAGVDVIEAGFPISSEGDFHAVQVVAHEIRRPVIAALARCRRPDIERAWQALLHAARPRIHTFLATSDIHLVHKLRLSRRECLECARDSVRFAKSLCNDVEFSAEDATRSDPDFLCQVLEAAIDAGATTINIPDTVGYTVPSEYGGLISRIDQEVRKVAAVVLSAHCHDDLGLATANSLAAVAAGARQVECTVNGIGERAGNTSLEELVMALRVRSDQYPFDTAIQTEQLFPTSQLLSELTGVVVQPNKAIVGRNAFAHEAGIHQDGMIKNALTYEIMTPRSVGVTGSQIVLGKHSGRHALAVRCEQLGFRIDRNKLEHVYEDFLTLADTVKIVGDHHIIELVSRHGHETLHRSGRLNPEPTSISIPFVEAGAGLADPPPSLLRRNDSEQQEDYLWGV